MKKLALQAVLTVICGGLAACNSWNGNGDYSESIQKPKKHEYQTTEQPGSPVSHPSAQKEVGGQAASNMDSIDRSKLWHALDKPLGKASSWTNASNRINYTVTPVQKMTIHGNTFCRKYQVTAAIGERSHVTMGTACVGADGNWEAARE